MPSLKISFIGGGSYLWGPQISTDLMFHKEYAGSTLSLYDVDRNAEELLGKLCRKIIREAETSFKIETASSLEESLEGADYVILSIGVGQLEAWEADLLIPEKYGIETSVGTDIGPAGISKVMRQIPACLKVAWAMEKICPKAVILNVTNPMTCVTRAISRESSITVIGLCHEVTGVISRLAKIFGVDIKEIEFVLGGINHLPWILDLKVRGKDGFSLLRDWLKEHGAMFYAKDSLDNSMKSVFMDRMALKFTIFEEFGYLLASGDRHIAEYFPYFLTEKTEWGLKYGVELTTYQHRVGIRPELKKKIIKKINQKGPLKLKHSGEQVARLISSYVTGRAGRYIINYPNKGQIANLPRDVVVECQALIGKRGIEPLCIGDLPPVIHQIVMSHILKQEIMVDAAVKRSKKLALQALLLDPLIPNWEEAKIILDEMLEKNKKYIPGLSN